MASDNSNTQQKDATDEILASVASSYSIDHTSFDHNLSSLLKRAVNDLGVGVPRANGVVKPYWAQCVNKFLTAYTKTKSNPQAFMSMFSNYHQSHPELDTPLFPDEECNVVKDSFFKDVTVHPVPKDPSRESSRSISSELTGGGNEMLGPVVYFKMDAPALASACVPIGEIYRAAVKFHINADESNVRHKLFPTLCLLDFYSVLYHSLPSTHPSRDKLARNIEDLCEAAEAVGPGTGPGASKVDGATSDELGNMDGAFETIASMLGTLTGNNANTGPMSDAIRGVGGVVRSLVERLTENGAPVGRNEDGSIDPAAIVGRLGSVFQSPEVQQQIAETARTASSALGGMGFSTTGTSPSSSNDVKQLE